MASRPPIRPFRWPRFAAGLRDARRAGYGVAQLRSDLLAGLTVGIVAVPLAMALAIATGVPPQHGLYTAIIAGICIALTGGSRFNVSGPTAAFVVVLLPVVQLYGLGGLLVATVMAGLILVAMGLGRVGGLIQFVPYPVVLGFTAGIGMVIATLQVPDFMGLTVAAPGTSHDYLARAAAIVAALPTLELSELLLGCVTLGVLIAWPRLKLPLPAPLVALAVATVIAIILNSLGMDIETISDRFDWQVGDQSGRGIPPLAPTLAWPWDFPGPDGAELSLDFGLVRALLGPAITIALLAAIESLLCAVMANGLTRTRHDPNSELIGQGIGNIVAPFFGGITATAAIARTATGIRSGAYSPLAAVMHSVVVLLAVIALAGLLGRVPMAGLAALLFVVAWNMSEPRLFLRTLRAAPRGDAAILLVCFLLTVLFDMVLAVGVGVGLAAMLFIQRMAGLTHSSRVQAAPLSDGTTLPPEVAVYDVNGPLFFAAAEKAVTSLQVVDPGVRVIVLDMSDVPSMDATAVFAVHALAEEMRRQGVGIVIAGLQPRMVLKLLRAGLRRRGGELAFCRSLPQGVRRATRWAAAPATGGATTPG